MLFDRNDIIGRCSVYINSELKYEGSNTASIGNYECIDDENASAYLIRYVTDICRNKGIKNIIGPMEGSTWNKYRFSIHNNYPNFF